MRGNGSCFEHERTFSSSLLFSLSLIHSSLISFRIFRSVQFLLLQPVRILSLLLRDSAGLCFFDFDCDFERKLILTLAFLLRFISLALIPKSTTHHTPHTTHHTRTAQHALAK